MYAGTPITPSQISDPVHIPTDNEIDSGLTIVNDRIQRNYYDGRAYFRVTDIDFTIRRALIPIYTTAGWTITETSALVGSVQEFYWTVVPT